MSDGPHRSLPMRPCWKRVAERADKPAFAPEDVSDALIPAIEEDFRSESSPDFPGRLRDALRAQNPSLFKLETTGALEALREITGSGLGQAVLDHVIRRCEKGETGVNVAAEATLDALTDRAARGARQVEEHYYRKSTALRADNVRTRIEDGIGNARSAIEALSRRLMKIETGPAARVIKKRGLEDGVKL